MRQIKMDSRDRADLIEHIKGIAPYYTPEWRFNPENADVGTALALIWADMFADTLQIYNKALERNKIAFYNALGADLKPPTGAEGFLCFELQPSDEIGGYIKKGTSVFAYLENGRQIFFETQSGLYVTPAKITDIFSVLPLQDKLIHCWHKDKGEGYLFHKDGENLQRHCFYISHESIFDVNHEGCMYINFRCNQSDGLSPDLFVDRENVLWEYYGEDGFVPFSKITAVNGKIGLQFDEQAPPMAEARLFDDLDERRYIKFTLLQPALFQRLFFEEILLSAQNYGLKPSVVYANGLEQQVNGFYPFGERFLLYNDLYVACDEAFTKNGADIEFSFDLRFVEFEGEDNRQEEIKWKLIMRKKELEKRPSYKIRIARTILEYFNGQGWCRLPGIDSAREQVFSGEAGSGAFVRTTIHFTCPNDMSPILIHAYEKKYIRIRIYEIENAYRENGQYVAPWIENLLFCYRYKTHNVYPQRMVVESNGQRHIYNAKSLMKKNRIHFVKNKFKKTAAYYCFDKPPEGAVIQLLFHTSVQYGVELPQLNWEYYSEKGWRALTVYDETDHFRKTGLITFTGHRDYAFMNLLGADGFWIRSIDKKSQYEQQEQKQFPHFKAIYLNTAKIMNEQPKEAEGTGDGEASNLKAYTVDKFTQTNHFIRRIYNPLPTVGGCDRETTVLAISRNTGILANRNRAVTAGDYEALAMEASGNVAKCKCYANITPEENIENGFVTLVVLHKDYQDGDEYFYELRRKLKHYILERSALSLTAEKKFEVVRPRFIRMHVKISCTTDCFDHVFAIEQEIQERLRRFLNCTQGNFDGIGWEIGVIPSPMQIMNYLKNTPHVNGIETILITYYTMLANGMGEVDLDGAKQYPFVLPENGEHDIFVNVNQ